MKQDCLSSGWRSLCLKLRQMRSIKKEPQIQHKIVSTALALLTEAETLEEELKTTNLRSDNSISE